MNEKYYPYRVKTEEELFTEYGCRWKDIVSQDVGWNDMMLNILGKDYPHEYFNPNDHEDCDCLSIIDDNHYNWVITKKFLKKKISLPNYKPKNFSREI